MTDYGQVGAKYARTREIVHRLLLKKGRSAIQAESLGQAALVALVRAELDALLPEPLADVRVREDQERERMRRVLAAIDDAED